MPDFAYVARDLTGQRVTGVVAAATEREALNVLGGQSLFPLEVKSQRPAKDFRFRRPSPRPSSGRHLLANGGLVTEWCSAAAFLTCDSGPDIEQESEERADRDPRPSRGRGDAGRSDGPTPQVFGELPVSMVRAGGEGGFLEEALERVAQFTEEFEDLKARTAGALAYPMFLAVAGTLIVAGLMIFFVPKFAMMFDRLRSRGELTADDRSAAVGQRT
jgi:type II secretory pathway component PulF